jgi:hypothetical protein
LKQSWRKRAGRSRTKSRSLIESSRSGDGPHFFPREWSVWRAVVALVDVEHVFIDPTQKIGAVA